jgi:hypothetical protein
LHALWPSPLPALRQRDYPETFAPARVCVVAGNGDRTTAGKMGMGRRRPPARPCSAPHSKGEEACLPPPTSHDPGPPATRGDEPHG